MLDKRAACACSTGEVAMRCRVGVAVRWCGADTTSNWRWRLGSVVAMTRRFVMSWAGSWFSAAKWDSGALAGQHTMGGKGR